ncbi:hypothetical protein PoB_007232100 [Plakobranchus ocellatus]|uniref:Uncharacterized protein n=1 Tax=Plakobranchus ocellatus TaxID=259542 RepID=A0AAV4DNX6_9GAST|nr:hypothetical protein PoB_007232100 [Plakobranchus ocellatus]
MYFRYQLLHFSGGNPPPESPDGDKHVNRGERLISDDTNSCTFQEEILHRSLLTEINTSREVKRLISDGKFLERQEDK